MKKIVFILIALLLIVGSLIIFFKNKKNNEDKETGQLVVAAKVELGYIRMGIESNGKVVSNLDVEIKCKASGEIIKLPFDISDIVKKGDLLLELDPVDEQRQVNQANTQLLSSNANLINAKENLNIAERNLITDKKKAEINLTLAKAKAYEAKNKAKRLEELLKKNLSSREDYEKAITASIESECEAKMAEVKFEELKTQVQSLEVNRQQIKIAASQVEADMIALDLAKQRLADTKIISPIDGVIAIRSVQIGQIISSGISNIGGGTTALTVSDLSRIFILAAVDESDIGKVLIGQVVNISVDAYPDKIFKGKITRIATKGVNISNVVTFEVKIEVISKEKELLKPEMTANVNITVAEKNNALLISSDAVIRKEGKNFVSIKDDKTQKDREVIIGVSDGQKTEIVSGLKEREIVVIRKNDIDSKWKGKQGPPPIRIGGRR